MSVVIAHTHCRCPWCLLHALHQVIAMPVPDRHERGTYVAYGPDGAKLRMWADTTALLAASYFANADLPEGSWLGLFVEDGA
jgi:hypothetical protein